MTIWTSWFWWLRSRSSLAGSPCADVNEFRGALYVNPQNRALHVNRSSPPVQQLALDAADEQLGAAVRAALDWSARTRRPPREGASDQLLAALGARSWRELERSTRQVFVSLGDDGQQIRLVRMHLWANREERERGMVGACDVVVPAAIGDAALGASIRLELGKEAPPGLCVPGVGGLATDA
ncbi:MAG: hypothetical protein H6835_01950 [Planctomycetes bacterium]|nr:hypothetical protein [Planctomycetota bacterium]